MFDVHLIRWLKHLSLYVALSCVWCNWLLFYHSPCSSYY